MRAVSWAPSSHRAPWPMAAPLPCPRATANILWWALHTLTAIMLTPALGPDLFGAGAVRESPTAPRLARPWSTASSGVSRCPSGGARSTASTAPPPSLKRAAASEVGRAVIARRGTPAAAATASPRVSASHWPRQQQTRMSTPRTHTPRFSAPRRPTAWKNPSAAGCKWNPPPCSLYVIG
jgi:hypothetical protein